MKALVLRELGGPLRMEEMPTPEIGPRDALVRVRACGVCRTDLKIRDGIYVGSQLPLILGHEPAGEVAAVGSEVQGLQPGDRVAVACYVTCGNCEPCRIGRETLCENFAGFLGNQFQGAYAEYLRVPAVNLCPIPDNLSFEHAAILADAVATPFHALRERARVRPGETVVIDGAGGGLGLHAVQIARLCGARVIAVDVSEERLQMARELGADDTIVAGDKPFGEEVRRLTGGRGAEVALELVGTPGSISASLRSLRSGGRLAIVGYQPGVPFEVDPLTALLNEWEILGSRAATKQELANVVKVVAQGRIRPIVTQVFPWDEVEQVHSLLRSGSIIGRAVITI